MLTRTAVFEGSFAPGNKERFFAAVEERLAPLWREFPHALALRWFKVDEADETARPIVMIQQIDYPSREAMAEALSSSVRDRARAATMQMMELLEGTYYHYVSEGGPR